MRSTLAPGERPLVWVAAAKKDLLAMPKPVIREMGIALGVAQQGGSHPSAKPWKGEGPSVLEIVSDFDGDTFRGRLHAEVPESDLCSALLSEEIAERDQDREGRCEFDCAATESCLH
jgi:hypothetical protein